MTLKPLKPGMWVSFIFLMILVVQPCQGQSLSQFKSIERKLRLRKASFDDYIKNRDKKKLEDQKGIRILKGKRLKKKTLALKNRKEFVRALNKNNRIAYKKFLIARKKKRSLLNEGKKSYRKMKKKYRKLVERKEFFVDKSLHFKL